MANNILSFVEEAANQYGIPSDIALRMVNKESGGNQSALSPKGAIGVMQLMPDTAKGLGVDPYNTLQNIDGGMRYLRQQFDRFGSWDKAVAAYHAGPGAVEKAGGIPGTNDGLTTTADYVRSIVGNNKQNIPSADDVFAAAFGDKSGPQKSNTSMSDALFKAAFPDNAPDHSNKMSAMDVLRDVGQTIPAEAKRLGYTARDIGLSLLGGLGLADDEAATAIIGQSMKDKEALYQPKSTAGKIVQGVEHMAPAIAASLINPLLGVGAFVGQGTADAGMAAIDEGHSLANAQAKAVAGGALNSFVGNAMMGKGNELLSRAPVVGNLFKATAADSASALAKRAAQGAATMAAFKPVSTGVDQLTDIATGEPSEHPYDYIPGVEDLAIGAIAGLPHSALEYRSRNDIPSSPTVMPDGSVAYLHSNGMPFSSEQSARSFIESNKLEKATPSVLDNEGSAAGYMVKLAEAPTIDSAIEAGMSSVTNAGKEYKIGDLLMDRQEFINERNALQETGYGDQPAALLPNYANPTIHVNQEGIASTEGMRPSVPEVTATSPLAERAKALGMNTEQPITVQESIANRSTESLKKMRDAIALTERRAPESINQEYRDAVHQELEDRGEGAVPAVIGHTKEVSEPKQFVAAEAARIIRDGAKIDAERAYLNGFRKQVGKEAADQVEKYVKSKFLLSVPEMRSVEAMMRNDGRSLSAGREVPKAENYGGFTVLHPAQLPIKSTEVAPGVTRISRSTHKMLNKAAKIFGKKLVIYKSDAPDKLGAGSGFVFNNDNNTIYIRADHLTENAIHPLVIFGHELTHTMQTAAPDLYKTMADAIKSNVDGIEALYQHHRYEDRKTLINSLEEFKERMDSDKDFADHVLSEFVADIGGNRAGEYEHWVGVFNAMADKSLVHRVADFIVSFINRMLSREDVRQYESDQWVSDLKQVRSAVTKAMSDYAARTKIDRYSHSEGVIDEVMNRGKSLSSERNEYRAEREDDVKDGNIRFYHGGRSDVSVVENSGRFGALFASRDIDSASGPGEVSKTYYVDLPENKVLTDSYLNYRLPYKDVSDALEKVSGVKKGSEDFDSLYEFVVEQKVISEDNEDLALNIFRADDIGEAEWDAQAMRAKLARELGYDAVDVKDEHGTSYMILPGAKMTDVRTKIDRYESREGGRDPMLYVTEDTPDIERSSDRIPLGDLTPEQKKSAEKVLGTRPTKIDEFREFKKDWKSNVIQGLFDQFSPLKELSPKSYILARASKGGDSSLEALLMYGKIFVDSDGAYRVDYKKGQGINGFASVLAKVDGEHDRFLLWVSALRADRLKSIGLENLFDKSDIDTLKTLDQGTLKNGKSRKQAYADALIGLNEFNDSVLKLAEDSGLIDPETRKMYKDNPYVPFYRLSDEGVIGGMSIKSGLVNAEAWKRLKGGENKLNEDLLGNLVQNWSHLITSSAKNRAAKAALDAAVKTGIAHQVPNAAPGKGLVSYKENGTDKTFRVTDANVLDAITSIGFEMKVPKPFVAMKQALVTGVTINPAFKIRNLIRDSVAAVGISDLSNNPLKNIKQGIEATKEDSETRAQMLAGGGIIRFGSMLDGLGGANNVRKLVEKGVPREHILDDRNAIEKFWKQKVVPAFDAYQELGDRGEQVNRAALYEQLIKKGYSHLEASFWARDLMDFSMQGKWQAVRILTKVVPFMNARLQGMYKLGRATKADYKKMGAVIAATAMASIALMLLQKDDEDWKKLDDYQRDNNWCLKIGDYMVYIPKPFEIGAVGTIAERGIELMVSDEMTGKRFAERMAAIVSQQLSMSPTPQLLKPIVDIYANKDSFTGRAIEGLGMDKLQKRDRYNYGTSATARVLGQLGLPNPSQLAMGHWDTLSPVQVDSLIKGYFGWLGTASTVALDYGIRPMLGEGDRPDRKLDDVFLAGNFIKSLPSNQSRYVTQLYDQAKVIEEAYGSYQAAIKQGDVSKAVSIYEDNAKEIGQYRIVEKIKDRVAEINKRIKSVQSSTNLDGTTKRNLIDQLNQAKNKIAEQLVIE